LKSQNLYLKNKEKMNMEHKNFLKGTLVSAILVSLIAFTFCQSGQQKNTEENTINSRPVTKRIGMVIKLDSTRIEEYLALHADSNPGVRDLLNKYHIENFSIFMTQLDDGNYYEFGYYEYTGSDYEADMAALDAEPRNKEWLKICDPMQIPLEGETSWKQMKLIYYNK